MVSVTATEFIKSFGQHNTTVQREPIAVTNQGRVTGYYVSAHEFEEMRRQIETLRKSHTLKTMPDALWKALMESKVDPQYDHLNALLDGDPNADSQ